MASSRSPPPSSTVTSVRVDCERTHDSEQSDRRTWLARNGCDRLFGEPCRDGDRVQVEVETTDARGLSLEQVDHRIEVSEYGFGKMLGLRDDSVGGRVSLESYTWHCGK